MNLLRSLNRTLFHVYDCPDLTPWQHSPSNTRPIYGVYHVFCARGWQRLVADQFAHLKRSGLLDATTTLFVSCIVFSDDDVEQLRRIIDTDKLCIASIQRNPRLFEYPALAQVKSVCKEENCLVYYFHTKGISFYGGESSDKHYLWFMRNVESWRKEMEYFLMDQWKVAVNTLSEGYDMYGSYRWPPLPAKRVMYSGNFWWTKADYVRTLSDIYPEQMTGDRLFAELWLYKGGGKDFSAFDTDAILYRVNIPKCIYDGSPAPWTTRLRFVIAHNWSKIKKKVFRQDFGKRYNDKYQKK